MIRSWSKYAVVGPRLKAWGEAWACWDCASGVVYRVVVRMPWLLAVR